MLREVKVSWEFIGLFVVFGAYTHAWYRVGRWMERRKMQDRKRNLFVR